MTALVTGIGIASPIGSGVGPYWDAALGGTRGISPITRFDAAKYRVRLAGEVRDFEPAELLPTRLMPQTDHMTRMSLVAAEWALADAGVRPAELPEYEMAVVTGATAGGYDFGQRELQKLWGLGPDHVSTYQSFAWFYAVNTGQISIRHGMRGPGAVIVTEQSSGLDAVGHARRQLRKGSRVAVTGGIDSSLCPWAWVAHLVAGQLSERDDPASAYLPFDASACGHVPGEGGALLVLETAESAAQRGAARCYGEIAGYAATFGSRREDSAPALGRAAALALADAGMTAADIDVVFADAAGQPALDETEARVIAELFGPHGVPVTAPKTMTGRLYAGGAALDLATALLAITHDQIPPTVNVRDVPERYRIDLVREARSLPVRAALVLSRGRGGFCSAVVAREYSTVRSAR
ncbi:MAG TPA: ketosynthase chain-length factor [Streptosporangiaceae bacterium]|nr:ketosynthase chain-length factor [Streptosporangiaceae bacterium]